MKEQLTPKQLKVKNSITKSATKIFSQLGYDKSSLNKIAEETGKGKSTLYYYFKSKEEIFKEVLRIEAESIWAKVNDEISKESSPQNKIRVYILTRMKAIKKKINYTEALKNEMLHTYEFINRIRQEFNQREQKAIQKILDYGVKNQTFKLNNTRLTAEAIGIAIRGFEVPLITDFHSEKEIEKKIDELIYILFNGILYNPGSLNVNEM